MRHGYNDYQRGRYGRGRRPVRHRLNEKRKINLLRLIHWGAGSFAFLMFVWAIYLRDPIWVIILVPSAILFFMWLASRNIKRPGKMARKIADRGSFMRALFSPSGNRGYRHRNYRR